MILKKYTIICQLLFVALTLGLATSCSDDEIIEIEKEAEFKRVTDESGVVLVNKDVIEVGAPDEDLIFEMSSTIMDDKGKHVERTLNCCGMGALALKDGATDSTRKVENVTLINRGTINIHTANLFKQYEEQIQTPEHPERRYKYLRFPAMYIGKNCMAINEGTINVYFDHDETTLATIYAMALTGSDGSSLINKGYINFYGTGSVATRLRGMATFGDNVSALNTGEIQADVAMSEDARMITTGGNNSNVINDGYMKMHLPGKALCMTRYGNSNIINNGVMEIISVDMPANIATKLPVEERFVCGLYDPLTPTRTQISSPMLNKGTIKVTLEGSDSDRQGYGMMTDLIAANSIVEVSVRNEGVIQLNQQGAAHFDMAEAGFIGRTLSIKGASHIKLNRWKTTLRDFSVTKDLFLARGVHFDFTGAEICFVPGEQTTDKKSYSVAPEYLVFNADHEKLGYRYELEGYENMKFSSGSNDFSIIWDKDNRLVMSK